MNKVTKEQEILQAAGATIEYINWIDKSKEKHKCCGKF